LLSERIVFHLPGSWLGPFGTGLLPFYDKLLAGLRARGIATATEVLDRDRLAACVAADDAFHIVNHGRMRHPRVLNAGIAYVYPFWHLDPWGIRAFSSIAAVRFDPAAVDVEAARPFFRRLRKRLVGARTSRYAQPEARAEGLPEGAAAVFLQSEGHRIVGETCHLTRWEMLEATLAGWDGPVVVKPHPRDNLAETRERLRDYAARFARLHVSTGNIHDILAACDRVVTINSAVGIEAYLHRKPVILCGQADFHHIAQVARRPDELAGFLAAPARRRAYDKYIHWYFAQNCLSTTEPALVDRFLDRVAVGGAAG